ncbi:hypothetical protein Tco_1265030 [Tanacetum coccineum]
MNMDPLDISRNPSKEKGKKIVFSLVISSSSSSSNDNEAPSFLEFYDELSDSKDLTKAQREKRGMFKCLNCYVGTITKTSRNSNDPYVQTMEKWPPDPSNPSPPPRVSRPPLGFPNPPPRFEPLPSTQPLFVNINYNTPLLHNNAHPLKNIHHPPPNLGNQDFPNPSNILDFAHPNDMPHLHNMFCQCCSTTRHEIQMLQNCDIQDSPDDEKDIRSSQEYMNDLEEEYQVRALLTKSKDEEEVSSNDDEMVEIKDLMALTDEERIYVGKESSRNGEWIKIYMTKNKEIILCQKHRNLVQELNTCKEQLLVLKQTKLDLLTMHHVNTEILKENQNLKLELKELTSITKTWLNSSNKVNQYISEQIPTQKKKILGIDHLTKDTSSSGQKDLVFVKSSADNSIRYTPDGEKPCLSEAEGLILPNHDTDRILSVESQRNTSDPSVASTDSLVNDYDSTDESSVCSTPLPPLEKLPGAEPVSGPKTIKSFLKSNCTFKANALKVSLLLNHPQLLLRCERTDHRTCDHAEFMSSTKINQHLTGQGESTSRSRPSWPGIPFPSCIHCGYNDHQFDDCAYYSICGLCGSYDHDTHDHNRIISLIRGIKPRNPQHVTKNL